MKSYYWVGRAAKVCAFLFEILRLHSVLSVQIAGFYKEPSFWYQCGLLDYQCRQLGEKFVLIWYFSAKIYLPLYEVLSAPTQNRTPDLACIIQSPFL